jgi:hypothetical protein
MLTSPFKRMFLQFPHRLPADDFLITAKKTALDSHPWQDLKKISPHARQFLGVIRTFPWHSFCTIH